MLLFKNTCQLWNIISCCVKLACQKNSCIKKVTHAAAVRAHSRHTSHKPTATCMYLWLLLNIQISPWTPAHSLRPCDQVSLVVPHSGLKADASSSFRKVPSDQKLDEFKTRVFSISLSYFVFLHC